MEGVEEVILATSFTAEGEATAHVLAEALRARGIRSTRLARGVPVGASSNTSIFRRLPTPSSIAA